MKNLKNTLWGAGIALTLLGACTPQQKQQQPETPQLYTLKM